MVEEKHSLSSNQNALSWHLSHQDYDHIVSLNIKGKIVQRKIRETFSVQFWEKLKWEGNKQRVQQNKCNEQFYQIEGRYTENEGNR